MKITDPKPFTDPLMNTMTLTSGVNGSDYELRVCLPYTYFAEPKKAYPVFVLLDGEGLFLTASDIVRNSWATSTGTLSDGTGQTPEFIVVGVCLPGTNLLRRNFEYMPLTRREEFAPSMQAFVGQVETALKQKLETGGTDAFLKVLETEILPTVAQQYRVDRHMGMLFGHSAGGTFVTQVLLTRPDLFTDYIIASPGLVPESFRQEEAWAAKHKDLKARVLLAAGKKESRDPLAIVSSTLQLAQALGGRNYPGLKLETWIVPEATHSQTPVASISRAVWSMGGLQPA